MFAGLSVNLLCWFAALQVVRPRSRLVRFVAWLVVWFVAILRFANFDLFPYLGMVVCLCCWLCLICVGLVCCVLLLMVV